MCFGPWKSHWEVGWTPTLSQLDFCFMNLSASPPWSLRVLSRQTVSHPTALAVTPGTPSPPQGEVEGWPGERAERTGQNQQTCEALMGCSSLTLSPCPSQKPALGHHHRNPTGDGLLHSHECFLLHCDDAHRAPAVTGGGRGESPESGQEAAGVCRNSQMPKLRCLQGMREIIV